MYRKIKWYKENIKFALKVRDVCNIVAVICVALNFLLSIIYTSLTDKASDTLSCVIIICWLFTFTIVAFGIKMIYKCECRIKEWESKKRQLMDKMGR